MKLKEFTDEELKEIRLAIDFRLTILTRITNAPEKRAEIQFRCLRIIDKIDPILIKKSEKNEIK